MANHKLQLYNKGMPRRKDREFTDEEKNIFRLGVSEGEQRMTYQLELFKIANRRLFHEIERMESYDPLVFVKVLPEEIPQIVSLLRIAGRAKGVSSKKRKLSRKLVRVLHSRLKKAQSVEIGEGKNDIISP